MSDVLLSCQNLTKRFGGLAAVNDVSLELNRGRIHAVIGPNGAGKSTLTNLLSGDLALTSGSVNLGKHWQLWMGLFIVLLVCFAPRGILGLAEKLMKRKGATDE